VIREVGVFELLDIELVLDVFNAQFGDNYITNEQLLDYHNNPNSVCIVCKDQYNVLGVSIAVVDSLENTSKQLLIEQDWFKNEFKYYSKIALRKHMAVKPGYEGQGIGSLLVKESVMRLKVLSDKIITIVWKEGDGEIMHRLMTKNCFQAVKTINDYWSEDSINHQYICPECKVIPCGCSAVIYSMKVRLGHES
jgi:GNAT superfamily N-acetyltransferase